MINPFILSFICGFISILIHRFSLSENFLFSLYGIFLLNNFLLLYEFTSGISEVITVSLPGHIYFYLDFNVVFLIFVSSFLASIFVWLYSKWIKKQTAIFSFFMFFMLFGSYGVLMTEDIFNLYVWMEVILISSVGFLFLFNTSPEIIWNYCMNQVILSLCILLSVCSIYCITGNLDLARLDFTHTYSLCAYLLLYSIFLAKIGLPPLHFWIYNLYVSLDTFMLGILLSIPSKILLYRMADIYGAFNMYFILHPILIAFWLWKKYDIKSSLILISILHSVYCLIIFPLCAEVSYNLGALYVGSSMITTALIFLCYELSKRGGVFLSHIFTFTWFVTLGLPPFIPFIGKWLLTLKLFDFFPPLAFVILSNVIFALMGHRLNYLIKNSVNIQKNITYFPIILLFCFMLTINIYALKQYV